MVVMMVVVAACGGSRDLSRENAELERCGLPVPTAVTDDPGLFSSRSTDFLVVHFDASSTAQSAWDVQMEYSRREVEEGRRPLTVADASLELRYQSASLVFKVWRPGSRSEVLCAFFELVTADFEPVEVATFRS